MNAIIVCRECGVKGHGALTALCPIYNSQHKKQDSKSKMSQATNPQIVENKPGGKRGIEPLSGGDLPPKKQKTVLIDASLDVKQESDSSSWVPREAIHDKRRYEFHV